MKKALKTAGADPKIIELAEEVVHRCPACRLWLPMPAQPNSRITQASKFNILIIIDNIFDGKFSALAVIDEGSYLGQGEMINSRDEHE
eukprot:9515365-Heterocapsa_arctica.AAC.1